MPPLTTAITAFLTDLEQANRSPHTQWDYASDLTQFATSFHGSVADITVEVLRQFFIQCQHLQPATRARKQAALASFLTWAVKHDLIAVNPMVKIERVQHAEPAPRGSARTQIDAILACIPREPQPVVAATLLVNPGVVVRGEEEVTGKLGRRWGAGVATIAGRLLIGQKFNGHRFFL